MECNETFIGKKEKLILEVGEIRGTRRTSKYQSGHEIGERK